jgi:hypothetical protein
MGKGVWVRGDRCVTQNNLAHEASLNQESDIPRSSSSLIIRAGEVQSI